MVTLMVKASKSETLFEHLHELGTAFYAKTADPDIYLVVYFSSNRQVRYEGPLSDDQIRRLRDVYCATEAESIEYDKFRDELIVTEKV